VSPFFHRIGEQPPSETLKRRRGDSLPRLPHVDGLCTPAGVAG
jgi:hypothetical protein